MAIMLNARSNVYENISFSASQPPDSSTISQIAGIAVIDLSAYGGGTIRFEENAADTIEIGDLDASDFVFYESPDDGTDGM